MHVEMEDNFLITSQRKEKQEEQRKKNLVYEI